MLGALAGVGLGGPGRGVRGGSLQALPPHSCAVVLCSQMCVCVCCGAAMCLVEGHRRVMMASGVRVCLKGRGAHLLAKTQPRAHTVYSTAVCLLQARGRHQVLLLSAG